jgi:hypothetical protein
VPPFLAKICFWWSFGFDIRFREPALGAVSECQIHSTGRISIWVQKRMVVISSTVWGDDFLSGRHGAIYLPGYRPCRDKAPHLSSGIVIR